MKRRAQLIEELAKSTYSDCKKVKKAKDEVIMKRINKIELYKMARKTK